MNNYKARIEETLTYETIVKADTKEEAMKKIKEMYRNEEIVLDASHHANTEFSIIEKIKKKDEYER